MGEGCFRGPARCEYEHIHKPPLKGVPEHTGKEVVMKLRNARRKVLICIYRLTYDIYVDEILRRANMGVKFYIITDLKNRQNGDNEDLPEHEKNIQKFLGTRNIEVRSSNPRGNMHNKYAIIDDEILIFGSMNWSYSGLTNNSESLMISHKRNDVHEFKKNFILMWKNATEVTRSSQNK